MSAQQTSPPFRITFVTIGETPRTDIVPEVCGWLEGPLDVSERGALDGMSDDAIAALAPASDRHALVSRRRDGREVVLARSSVAARIQQVLDGVTPVAADLVVLLCTGRFDRFRVRPLFLESQAVVDHMVAAVAGSCRVIGVMVPLARQTAEFDAFPPAECAIRFAHASPYRAGELERAAAGLRDVDLVVMHCMGYTEAMRRAVAEACGRPVLLARRLVAGAIAQIVAGSRA